MGGSLLGCVNYFERNGWHALDNASVRKVFLLLATLQTSDLVIETTQPRTQEAVETEGQADIPRLDFFPHRLLRFVMSHEMEEYYRTLEIRPGATWVEVRHSYRELVKVWHPDRFARDPNLERRAQEKLKQINLAFEQLERIFSENGDQKSVPTNDKVEVTALELFLEAQKLFFGDGVELDLVKAIKLLRKSAEMGFSSAQNLLGHAYYHGQGLSKSQRDAEFWWKQAAEKMHEQAQYSLGCLYYSAYSDGIFQKVAKNTLNWQGGSSNIEAFKWFNLAITYGAGRKAGLGKVRASDSLTDLQRNEAMVRASAYYPKYDTASSTDVFGQLFDWYIEEGNSSPFTQMKSSFSGFVSQTGNLQRFRNEVSSIGVENLVNGFRGETLAKSGDFLKAVGSRWTFNRSSADWARQIALTIIEFPYDYLSDLFIRRRENAINQIWVNSVNR